MALENKDNILQVFQTRARHQVISPNGELMAWESMERDGYEADKIRLFVMNLKTGEKKEDTKD